MQRSINTNITGVCAVSRSPVDGLLRVLLVRPGHTHALTTFVIDTITLGRLPSNGTAREISLIPGRTPAWIADPKTSSSSSTTTTSSSSGEGKIDNVESNNDNNDGGGDNDSSNKSCDESTTTSVPTPSRSGEKEGNGKVEDLSVFHVETLKLLASASSFSELAGTVTSSFGGDGPKVEDIPEDLVHESTYAPIRDEATALLAAIKEFRAASSSQDAAGSASKGLRGFWGAKQAEKTRDDENKLPWTLPVGPALFHHPKPWVRASRLTSQLTALSSYIVNQLPAVPPMPVSAAAIGARSWIGQGEEDFQFAEFMQPRPLDGGGNGNDDNTTNSNAKNGSSEGTNSNTSPKSGGGLSPTAASFQASASVYIHYGLADPAALRLAQIDPCNVAVSECRWFSQMDISSTTGGALGPVSTEALTAFFSVEGTPAASMITPMSLVEVTPLPQYSQPPRGPVFSIDVECVANGKGHNDRVPAEIALVDGMGNEVFHRYVNVGSVSANGSGAVVSYLTPLTGLSKEKIDAADPSKISSFEKAISDLKQVLPKKAILVGSSIESDIKWLGLEKGTDFAASVDLVSLFQYYNPPSPGGPIMQTRPVKFSLRALAMRLLALKDFQLEEHDPMIDARVSVRIFRECGSDPKAWFQSMTKLRVLAPVHSRIPAVIDGVCMRKYNKRECICGQE